jgi:AraC-like DNA-binding protein
MKRAAELFTFDLRSSRSPLIEQTWQTRSEPEQSFISVAVSHWEMVVTRQRGAAWLTVRGPETKATTAPVPEDAEFFGIQFSLGTFMPGLPPGQLADSGLTLPPATSTSFWLDGARWELPGPANADVFVDRLVRAGLLARDPVVPAALQGEAGGLSRRSVERRVSRATGLTLGTIGQIKRAERAVDLLRLGRSPLDVADQAGYADQPHLTRSLRRFVGRTPSQVATSPRAG